MNVCQLNKSKNYRKAARVLFSEVNKLIDEAGNSVDLNRRRELYLQAMGMSNEAYNLLGKAKSLSPAKPRGGRSRPGSAKKAY